jgi:hypothetical protein
MIAVRLLGRPSQGQSSGGTRSNEMATANVVKLGVYLSCVLGGRSGAGGGHGLKREREVHSSDHPRRLSEENAGRLPSSDGRLDER